MKEKIENAIRTTLVIENKQSIRYAVDKIIKLIEKEKPIPDSSHNPPS